MQSVAQNHYPQYVFRDGAKLLWNPILKKAFVDLPEERVRLQLIEYLILETDFPSSRISFEAPVNLPGDKSSSRTDIICFNKEFKPHLLVECKAPEVSLTEKASIQIARYNQKINAPLLLISNGLDDLWFLSKPDSISNLDTIPDMFESTKAFERDFDYWSGRGFTGKKSQPDTRIWISESCETLYGSRRDSLLKYFKFEGSSPELYMPNFYRVYSSNGLNKLAISLTGTQYGSTKLNGVLNVQGVNKAILSCSLDLVANGESGNTLIQSESGVHKVDLVKKAGFSFKDSIDNQINRFIELLIEM